jgi:hypothetical protein
LGIRGGLLRVKEASSEQAGGDAKAVEMSEEAGADVHVNSPWVETRMLLQSCA